MAVRRLYVEKKPGFNVEAKKLFNEIRETLMIKNLKGVRVLQRYDIEDILDSDFEKAKKIVFSEPPVDLVYEENILINKNERVIAVEYQPGQYDQRADSAAQCIQIITQGERPSIKVAKLLILTGHISNEEYDKIVNYVINPVETREASCEKPQTLKENYPVAADVPVINNFINMTSKELKSLMEELGFAMSFKDLEFCQNYFRDLEKRDPTLTELKMIDTYWSDHCRHTTFLTKLDKIQFSENNIAQKIKDSYDLYLDPESVTNAL